MSKKKFPTRDEEQESASDLLLEQDGSLIAGTGFGKTRTLLMAYRKAVTLGLQPSRALILVPFDHLRQRFMDEAEGMGLNLKEVTLMCYASIHTVDVREYDLIICDEVHLGLTERCIQVYDSFKGILWMSTATVPEDVLARGYMLRRCPIRYHISLDTCVERGYVAPYRIICASVELTVTEQKDYKTVSANFGYWKSRLGFDAFLSAQQVIRSRTASKAEKEAAYGFFRAIRQRKGLVDHAANKVILSQRLCTMIKGRKLVFGGDNRFTASLHKSLQGSRMYHSDMAKSESSKSLEDFKKGVSDILVSTKALNQGLDIPDASIGIICGLTSKALTMVQRIGRLVRIDPNDPKKTGLVVVLYVKDSQEQVWLESALKHISSGNVTWTTAEEYLQELV